MGRGILEFFCEKSCGPPTSWNGLMHDPSEIPKQKHLTLPPPTYPRQKEELEEATWSNFFLAKKNCDPPPVENKIGLTLPNL